jgi:hypothetical protein
LLLQLCQAKAGQKRQQLCQQRCCGCQHTPANKLLLLLLVRLLALLVLAPLLVP